MLVLVVGLVGAVAVAYLGLGLASASTTLGCDYFTYADAATRHLHGEAIYPAGVARTGECGLYQYPPPFLLFVMPFAALGSIGLWPWIALSLVAFAAGCAILPVKGWIRVAIFLLGAMGWPMVFGLRIGQVVPFLFFLSAVGWWSLDRPRVLGAAAGLGTLIKVQPGLVIAWLLLRGNLRALIASLATIAVVVVAGAFVGLGDWPTFLRILTQISSAVDVPANYAIGAAAHRLGLDLAAAGLLQTANTIAMLALVVAARWLPREPGFLLVVTVSQIVSPIVWTHYALALLLPVAWLLERRQWWILIVPLSHLWLLIASVPEQVYTGCYYVVIVALLVVGVREQRAAVRETLGVREAARARLQPDHAAQPEPA
jgi:hypothetical protein